MEVQGTVKVIEQTQSVGKNDFKKRGVVVTTDEQYPQMIHVEFVQDKTALLDSYQVGDKVKISINLRGREWINPEGVAKYFNAIQGWRIEKLEAEKLEAVPPAPAPSGDNDLPF